MRISKVSLILAFCLPVFLFSCRKDNGDGKYIVKLAAIGDGTVVGGITYKGKRAGGDEPSNLTSTTWTSDTIEGDGHLKIAAYVLNEKSGRIGVKMEVFKLGSGGKQTKVGSVRKSASKGFKSEDDSKYFYYGATIEFPGNKKTAIEIKEQNQALDKEFFN